MLKRLSVISLAVLGLAACGGSSNSSSSTTTTPPVTTTPPTTGTTPPTTPDSEFDQVRAMAQSEMVSNQSGAVSIAIYQDGEIVFAEAFGNTEWGAGSPVDTDTLFQLGSTTKMFTSLATMQLVDQGMISVDDTLTSTLTGISYPAEQAQGWQGVNIHHLMSNQSGFRDDYETISANSELMSYMLNSYGNANPQMVDSGRFFNYSNPNFSYLGALVEHFTQQEFRDVMEQSVFEPLGMQRTTMHKTQVNSSGNYTLGVYQDDDGNPRGYNHLDQVDNWPVVIPAGQYTWSTPTELLKMAEFLMSGNEDVLADDLRSQMTEAHVSMEYAGLPLNYGYGIFIDDGFIHQGQWYPEKVWQHGGNTEGYTSTFWMLPGKNIAVAILSSGYGDSYSNTMMAALRSVTELPEPGQLPLAEVDTSNFDLHEGTYDAGFMTIEVSNNNGVLNVRVPELDAEGVDYSRTLQAIGGNTFIANSEGEETDLTFFPQVEDGQSVYIRNRGFVGIREGSELSEVPAAARNMRTASLSSKLVLY